MSDADQALAAAILSDDNLHSLLSLPDEETGVTDRAMKLLANDAKTGHDREFLLRSTSETVTRKDRFLRVWMEYERSEFGALYVIADDGERILVHRKPDPKIGFTPFAKENLLFPSGYVKDTKRRIYVMGGVGEDGHRMRTEIKATVLVAWLTYAATPDLTRLWVKWKDGTRKLVHRKGL